MAVDPTHKKYITFDVFSTGPTFFGSKIVSITIRVGNCRDMERECHTIRFKVKWPTVDANGHIDDYGDFHKGTWEEYWARLYPHQLEYHKYDYNRCEPRAGYIQFCHILQDVLLRQTPTTFDQRGPVPHCDAEKVTQEQLEEWETFITKELGRPWDPKVGLGDCKNVYHDCCHFGIRWWAIRAMLNM